MVAEPSGQVSKTALRVDRDHRKIAADTTHFGDRVASQQGRQLHEQRKGGPAIAQVASEWLNGSPGSAVEHLGISRR